MSGPFVKHYPSSAARQAAEANYRWLAELQSRRTSPRTGSRERAGSVLRAHPMDAALAQKTS